MTLEVKVMHTHKKMGQLRHVVWAVLHLSVWLPVSCIFMSFVTEHSTHKSLYPAEMETLTEII